MGTKVQIANSIQEVPSQGESKWGEKTTNVILALVDVTNSLVGPADILIKESILSNNVTSPQPINGFKFDTTIVQSISATAIVVRTFPEVLALPALQDTITLEGSTYNGEVFYAVKYIGNNAGVTLTLLSNGQIEYTSKDIADTENIFIKFKGQAITAEEE
jgi:hypothetical protein